MAEMQMEAGTKRDRAPLTSAVEDLHAEVDRVGMVVKNLQARLQPVLIARPETDTEPPTLESASPRSDHTGELFALRDQLRRVNQSLDIVLRDLDL